MTDGVFFVLASLLLDKVYNPRIMKKCALTFLFFATLLSPVLNAITVTATSGALKADAGFTVSGSTLTLVLTNSASGSVSQPNQVLMGAFFNLPTGVSLTPVSAAITSGSFGVNGLNGSVVAISNVGAYWGFSPSVSYSGLGTNGVAASGLSGLFNQGSFFSPGANLGGADYGLVPAGFTGSQPLSNNDPLISKSMTFTFSFTGNLSESYFSTSPANVSFQYGTAPTETNIRPPGGNTPGVPDSGSSLALGGIALIAMGFFARRFSR